MPMVEVDLNDVVKFYVVCFLGIRHVDLDSNQPVFNFEAAHEAFYNFRLGVDYSNLSPKGRSLLPILNEHRFHEPSVVLFILTNYDKELSKGTSFISKNTGEIISTREGFIQAIFDGNLEINLAKGRLPDFLQEVKKAGIGFALEREGQPHEIPEGL